MITGRSLAAALVGVLMTSGWMDSGPVSMGTVEIKGGTTIVTVTASALQYGAGAELAGKLKNSTGRPANDVTIGIRKKGTAGGSQIPNIEGVTIGGTPGGVAGGTKVRVPLGGTSQPPAFQAGGEQDFTMDLGSTAPSTPPDDYEVLFTFSHGSDIADGQHFDVSQSVAVMPVSPSHVSTLALSGNPGFIVRMTNAAADPEEVVTAISGTVSLPSESGSITNVYVNDADGGSVSASISVNSSTTFSVTGLSIQAGATIDLRIRLNATPDGQASASLTASY